MEILYSVTANAVLEGACERVIVGDLYCDIPLGLYVIRGENVVLIGELVLNLWPWTYVVIYINLPFVSSQVCPSGWLGPGERGIAPTYDSSFCSGD